MELINVILSTRNPSKELQIKEFFAGSPSFKILTLDEAGIEGEATEDGTTLEENAIAKASFAFRKSRGNIDGFAMADDTGLLINALRGAPGVRSARWAGEHATTEEITAYTLRALEGHQDRSAIFRTVVALIAPTGKVEYFHGEVPGQILTSPRCPPQPKMPYSCIFIPDGSHKVFAEMTTAEENEHSHRGMAFRKAKEFLDGLLLSWHLTHVVI